MRGQTGYLYEFGPFSLNTQERLLTQHGKPVPLASKTFEALLFLVKNAGHLVTKDDLIRELWSDTFVEEANLAKHISLLRKALGEDGQEYIETVPKYGYRFVSAVRERNGVATIEEDPQQVKEAAPVSCQARPFIPQRWNSWLAIGLLAIRRSETTPAKNPRRRIFAAALAFFVVILAGLIVWRTIGRGRSSAKIGSLAVLPLENLSGSAAEDYFADGMTDDLITELGRIQPLRVISRTSVMRYKGVHKPLPQIAQELNVDAILEGTVMRSGSQIRITAQLIQALPEKHLWAQSYQRDLRDVLGLQNEIASAIAQAVQGTLSPPDRPSSRSQRLVIPAAYESYWKGEYFLDKLTPESLQTALNYFLDSIAKDPDYVPAYTKLAGTYQMLGNMGVLPKQESRSKSTLALEKALALDPQFGPAHAGKGWTALLYDLDFAAAGAEFNRAVELSPNSVEGHEGLAEYHAAVAQSDRAVLEIVRAHELDPLSIIVSYDVCRILYFARRFEDALAQCKVNLNMDPRHWRPLWSIGSIYAAMGEETEAASTFIQAFQAAGEKPARLIALTKKAQESGSRGMWDAALQFTSKDDQKQDPFSTASAYTYAGNKDEALTWLEHAFDERSFGIAWLAVDPTFDSLHSDARFQVLVAKLRIPQNE